MYGGPGRRYKESRQDCSMADLSRMQGETSFGNRGQKDDVEFPHFDC